MKKEKEGMKYQKLKSILAWDSLHALHFICMEPYAVSNSAV